MKDDSNDLLKQANNMINDINSIKNYNVLNTLQINKIINKSNKYNYIKTNYFQLYKGIIQKKVNKNNFHIFIKMLSERNKVIKGKKKLREASDNISDVLIKESNYSEIIKNAEIIKNTEKK